MVEKTKSVKISESLYMALSAKARKDGRIIKGALERAVLEYLAPKKKVRP